MNATDPQLLAQLKRVFRMPSVQSMKTRKTSITNAFVSAIVPVVKPSPQEILEGLTILAMTADAVECIYCGDKCNAWDHLRPIVVDRRPTGYISEIANLVPACQPCNSSKGNSPWKLWMLGEAPQSPKQRNVSRLEERVARLEQYERWRRPIIINFESIFGAEAYAAYWKELDQMVAELRRTQEMADALRKKVADSSHLWQPRPIQPSSDKSCA